VTVAFALNSGGNQVALPDYLNRCVTGTLLYHSHPSLTIIVSGSTQSIPANVGIGGICNKPIHTHDATGTLHVETDENRDYTLGDFFLIWGNWADSGQRAIFNSTQIFGDRVGNGHSLTMTVNNAPNNLFQNYPIPRNAGTSNSDCFPSPCTPYSIVITYS
jgi:hypothetical protein